MKSFVIVTPAKNEEKYLELTIKSVVSQTCLPLRWVIVDDDSTDSTKEIVLAYRPKNPFIFLVENRKNVNRDFGSKVSAFNTGYQTVSSLNFSYIGNIDADISFAPDYFEKLLKEFDNYPDLGLAGGLITEVINGRCVDQLNNINSVAGAVQLFRRSIFEKIGGYVPLAFGGIDTDAEIKVRMAGSEVRTFPSLKVMHHRPVSQTGTKLLKSKFKYGVTHYILGYHPAFLIMASFFRLLRRPVFIGSILRICGYFWAKINRYKQPISSEYSTFIKNEQISRLKSVLKSVRPR